MESHVDPFLFEALQNPRHRLTVLRMELDIQKFMHNSNQRQFEYQQFPTSYLRRVAHRVAQHYGLQTFSVDNITNSSNMLGSKIIAVKPVDSKFRAMCLSEVPAKYTDAGVTDQVKIAICKRPSVTSLTDVTERENRKSSVRSVEERKEEYDKARARIFNSSGFADSEDFSSLSLIDRRGFSSSGDELDCYSSGDENEKARAIFKDMEKDRWDPDYDRSYNRYVKGQSLGQKMGLEASNYMQPPFLQYEACSPVGLQYRRSQTPVAYRQTNSSVGPPCAFGCNGIPSKNAVYYTLPFPSPSVMHTESYGHFRHAIFQAPGYQHPLSFE